MLIERRPRVTFLIATFNRREVMLRTLAAVYACGLNDAEFEVNVVDNASTDGTAAAVRRLYPQARTFSLTVNQGPCAKNVGLSAARGEYVVFLDDDSFPMPGSVTRMIQHFEQDRNLGAAVFTITLPDGSHECSAYPDVCIGCGTGFRRTALLASGGLPSNFFMAAEEYDLSLRLLGMGWRVQTFTDLHVTHLKTPASRFPSRVARLDARNNVLLAMKYFPEPWRMKYVAAWLERYRLMACANGTRRAFWAGAIQGALSGIGLEQEPLSPMAFEQFAKLQETTQRMSAAADKYGLRRVMFADVGKNFLAYHEAADACGLEVLGIADRRLGGKGFRYRGLEVLTDQQAIVRHHGIDGVIISNLSPVHAALRTEQCRREFGSILPIIDLFGAAEDTCPTALAA